MFLEVRSFLILLGIVVDFFYKYISRSVYIFFWSWCFNKVVVLVVVFVRCLFLCIGYFRAGLGCEGG